MTLVPVTYDNFSYDDISWWDEIWTENSLRIISILSMAFTAGYMIGAIF
jgi:hypothetical protein